MSSFIINKVMAVGYADGIKFL